MPGAGSTAGLARLGFANPEGAGIILSRFGGDEALAELVGRAADPDAALLTLDRLRDTRPAELDGPLTSLREGDPGWLERVIAVAGLSPALAEHLLHVEGAIESLNRPEAVDVGHTPDGARNQLLAAVAGASTPMAAHIGLLRAYRTCLVQLLARDLCQDWPVERVSAELSSLADAVLVAALAFLRGHQPGWAEVSLAVIALGKAGGMELNYVSDVDVVFVTEDSDIGPAVQLAGHLVRFISQPGPGGLLWEVDTALRPEGRAGPLVRSLSSHRGYYERWAQTWEFQALLKARPVAGDLALGAAYHDALSPLVWSAAAREGFVPDVQAMRQRVERHLIEQDRDRAERQLKLGRGGLRDVEFSVQLLQLVHGRGDVLVRQPGTLAALEALATWGYVGMTDATALGRAYRFLRTVEHRLQVRRLRRTATLPEEPRELRILARSVGLSVDPVPELSERLRRERREVRRIHEKLFYRPLLDAVARLGDGHVRMTEAAATERLRALGYEDPIAAWRHLTALTSGVSRRAAIQRTLLPVMLEWFAEAPVPDRGLLAFRQLSEALGATPWFLRSLRDEGVTAEHCARLLSASRYATDLLMRAPAAMGMLASEEALRPASASDLHEEAMELARRHEDPVAAVGALRAMRRRELLRIAAAQVLLGHDVQTTGPALAAVTDAVLLAGLTAVEREARRARGEDLPTHVTALALGRYGGGEIGLGSDADVMFVHAPRPGSQREDAESTAAATVARLRQLLGAPHPDPPLDIDIDLRPDGRAGPSVRSVAVTAAYYREQAAAWERQALLRARVIGDGVDCLDLVGTIDERRYPDGGLPTADLREIRRLKARMESERLPRGVDPGRHLKLGPGGLSDVEWTVQLLQLRHAHAFPDLRVPSTLAALSAAEQSGLIAPRDAADLRTAWLLAARIRDATVHVRGRADGGTDLLPSATPECAALCYALGMPASAPGALQEQWRRASRRARAVTMRLFFQE